MCVCVCVCVCVCLRGRSLCVCVCVCVCVCAGSLRGRSLCACVCVCVCVVRSGEFPVVCERLKLPTNSQPRFPHSLTSTLLVLQVPGGGPPVGAAAVRGDVGSNGAGHRVAPAPAHQRLPLHRTRTHALLQGTSVRGRCRRHSHRLQRYAWAASCVMVWGWVLPQICKLDLGILRSMCSPPCAVDFQMMSFAGCVLLDQALS